MESILKMITEDIFLDIYKYIFSSAVFGFLITLILYIFDKKEDKKLKDYKWKFLFFMYLWFVFNKTLLDRKIGADNNFELAVKSNWLFIKGDKEDMIEGIENIIFFIPYSFFLLKVFVGNINGMI